MVLLNLWGVLLLSYTEQSILFHEVILVDMFHCYCTFLNQVNLECHANSEEFCLECEWTSK